MVQCYMLFCSLSIIFYCFVEGGVSGGRGEGGKPGRGDAGAGVGRRVTGESLLVGEDYADA